MSEFNTFIEKMDNAVVSSLGSGNTEIVNFDMNGGFFDVSELKLLDIDINSDNVSNNLRFLKNCYFE